MKYVYGLLTLLFFFGTVWLGAYIDHIFVLKDLWFGFPLLLTLVMVGFIGTVFSCVKMLEEATS